VAVGAERPDFDAFLSARLAALYRYALVLTRSRPDAEDLVQEALVRTAASWWRVRRKDDPEGYVRRVMIRLLMNERRRPIREESVPAVPENTRPDAGYAAVDDADSLDERLRRLPPRMRVVLVLRYVDGLSEAEIADALGVSRGTVKSQAARALQRLRVADGEVRETNHG
jgi:RNA polymerase sigma-70 factor (sigma-E family)